MHSVSIGGTKIVYREITIAEYEYILHMAQETSSVDSEDELVTMAVISPENIDLDDYPAGQISRLADLILENSGFSSPDSVRAKIERAREETSSIINFMKTMVFVSGQLNYEDMGDMTMDELTHKAAMAEKIFDLQQKVGSGDPVRLEVQGAEGGEVPAEALKASMTAEEWEKVKSGRYQDGDEKTTIGTASVADPIAQKLRSALEG